MDNATYLALKAKVLANKSTADKAIALGGFWQRTIQSDKLGFDWLEDWLGERLIKQTYVEQTSPKGTADNPIAWVDGVELIPNAYYNADVRRVWMGQPMTSTTLQSAIDSGYFVEF